MKKQLQKGLNSSPHILLNNLDLVRKGVFLLRYRGCAIIKNDEKDSAWKGRFMDILVPWREHGLIDIKLKSCNNSINHRIGMVECSEDDLHPTGVYTYNLILKIRNIMFFQAMLFVRYKGKLYRYMENEGPGYLQVSNETFYSVWNQVSKPQ